MINSALAMWGSGVDTTTVVLDSLSEVAGVWAGTFSAVDVVLFDIEVYDILNSLSLATAENIPFDSDMSVSGNWLGFSSDAGLVATDLANYTVAGSTITDTGTTLFSFDFQGFTANALGTAYADNIRITITASASSAIMAMNEALMSFNANYSTTGANELVTLPISGTMEAQIDWGDGSVTRGTAGFNTHTYLIAGSYDVRILGACAMFTFNNGGDKLKINSIAQWGYLGLTNVAGWFYGCSNLSALPSGAITGADAVTSLLRVFRSTAVTTADTGFLDNLINVVSVQELFQNSALNSAHVDLFALNTAITSFNSTFLGCFGFTGTINVDNNINATTFRSFLRNTNITSISATMFQFNTKVTTFQQCFSGCVNLVSASGAPWLLSGIAGYNLTSPLYDESTPQGFDCFASCNCSDQAGIPTYWK